MIRSKVIVSYSHEDERWRKLVVAQLGVLETAGLIEIWDDRKVLPGEDRLARLDREMLPAQVALLLISADFLKSPFILDRELPRLFDKHKQDGMIIYPLLVRACPWKSIAWLTRMQLRPEDGKPLSMSRRPKVDQLLADVASEIAKLTHHPPGKDHVVASANPLVPSVATRPSTMPVGAQEGFAYCTQCGLVPGNTPTKCHTGRNHFFKDLTEGTVVYCKQCGVTPGGSTTTCYTGRNHFFHEATTDTLAYCGQCGVTPGDDVTACHTGRNHFFQEVATGTLVYCGQCGMRPGNAVTKCNTGRNHFFKNA